MGRFSRSALKRDLSVDGPQVLWISESNAGFAEFESQSERLWMSHASEMLIALELSIVYMYLPVLMESSLQ